MINYKSFKHQILVTIVNYNCLKINIIIGYNRLLRIKLYAGTSQITQMTNTDSSSGRQ